MFLDKLSTTFRFLTFYQLNCQFIRKIKNWNCILNKQRNGSPAKSKIKGKKCMQYFGRIKNKSYLMKKYQSTHFDSEHQRTKLIFPMI